MASPGKTDACVYVPLDKYNWDIVPLLEEANSRCHGIALAWNPTVILLLVAFYAVTFWIGLEVIVQAMSTFRKWATVYFWLVNRKSFDV
jgi:hypothetical protein